MYVRSMYYLCITWNTFTLNVYAALQVDTTEEEYRCEDETKTKSERPVADSI